MRRLLEPAGLELEEGELLIEREILAERQVARIRRQPSRRGFAAEGTGAASGRYPRAA